MYNTTTVLKEDAAQPTETAKTINGTENKNDHVPSIKPVFDTGKLRKKKTSTEDVQDHLNEIEANEFCSFPYKCLPQRAQKIIEQWCEYLGFPRDFAAAVALSAFASGIGSTRRAKWMGGYDVISVLWMILVGNPGINKSTPVNTGYAPFDAKDDEYYDEHEQEWRDVELRRKGGEIVERLPRLKKCIVEDATLEALAQVFENNPRGATMRVDEIMMLIGNMNKYSGKDSDAKKYLNLFIGGAFNVDRATKRSLRAKSSNLNIIGTIQTTLLPEFGGSTRKNDGWVDRFLHVMPTGLRVPVWQRKKISPSVAEEWKEIINRLLSLEMEGFDVKPEAKYIEFSEEAETALIAWQEQSIKDDEAIDDPHIYSISAKLYIYVLRFSLVLHYAKWACGEGAGDDEPISKETAASAIQLAKYFKRQAISVSKLIHNKSHYDTLPKLKKDIYRRLNEHFTKAEAEKVLDGLNSTDEYKNQTLSLRSLETWLNDTNLFTKLKQGHYKKTILKPVAETSEMSETSKAA